MGTKAGGQVNGFGLMAVVGVGLFVIIAILVIELGRERKR